jgi:hypothetical protein
VCVEAAVNVLQRPPLLTCKSFLPLWLLDICPHLSLSLSCNTEKGADIVTAECYVIIDRGKKKK